MPAQVNLLPSKLEGLFKVIVGSGDVYGSFVGKTVTSNGVGGGPGGRLGIHYDPSLATGIVIPIVKTRW